MSNIKLIHTNVYLNQIDKCVYDKVVTAEKSRLTVINLPGACETFRLYLFETE